VTVRRRILWSALAVAAVTLLAGLLAGAAISRNLAEENSAELLRQADATATLIATSVRSNLTSISAGDATSVARTLEIAKKVGGHDYVEARVVGVEYSRLDELEMPESPLLDSLGPSPELDTIIGTEVDGEPVLAYVRSIRVAVRQNVRVFIAIGRAEPQLNAGLMLRPLILSLGIGAMLAVVFAYAIAFRLGRGLDDLASSSQRIAAGDFSVRAPEEGNDAFARLGGAFNEMVQQLEEGRLREQNFLMSVGHDLRTPLTTLRGYAEALEAGEIEPEDMERVASVLRRQTDRLSRLIEDLTLLSRLEAGEFTLRPEPVELAAHVHGLVDGQAARAEGMHIRLDSDVRDVGEVSVDPDRIDQILGNLIDNAIRYTPEGGAVTVALFRDDDEVVLSVADTGPGIDPEDLDHVFERLYVSQRYRPVRPEGSGLGLSIVRELVEAMGGSVDVTSSPERGTKVSVRLSRA